jgi:hypothetical protein
MALRLGVNAAGGQKIETAAKTDRKTTSVWIRELSAQRISTQRLSKAHGVTETKSPELRPWDIFPAACLVQRTQRFIHALRR